MSAQNSMVLSWGVLRRSQKRLDRIILGTAAVALSGAVMSIFFNDKSFSYVDGSPRYEAALGVVYAAVVIFAIAHLRQVMQVARLSAPLIAMIVLAFVSVAWAENPGLALRRSAALFGTTLVGVLLCARFTSEERLQLLSFILRALAIASLLFAVFIPYYGITNDALHSGDWVGVFNHKNSLGAYVGIAFLIDSYRPMRLRPRIFWFGLYTLLIIKSGSASPLAALLATWLVVAVFKKMRMRHHISMRTIAFTIAGTAGVGVIAALGSGAIQSALGRTANLSGRTQLWEALIPTIMRQPVLGYGYGAFWSGGSKEYYSVERLITWDPMYAHNGFLEIMVSLGIVGLILGLWFLAQGGLYAVRRADLQESWEDIFPIALFVYVLIRNITEVTLLYHNSLEWAICVATFLDVLAMPGRRIKVIDVEEPERQLVSSGKYA
jgi:exopolysaccharide production protein ExoQ